MAQGEGGEVEPSIRKRRVSRKGQKTGLVVGIAAVVLVGVAGKLLSRFVRLNKEASASDVLRKTLGNVEAARKLRKPSNDLVSAALSSASQKLNGEDSAAVNGRVLGEQLEYSNATQLNGLQEFVVSGMVQENAGVPSVRAEFQVSGTEDVQVRNIHGGTEVPGVELKVATGHQDTLENGPAVVTDEEIVEGTGNRKEVSISQVDGLPALQLVASVSYGENMLEVSCTTTSCKPLVQAAEISSNLPVDFGSCGRQEWEDSESDGFSVAKTRREPALEDTGTSQQILPLDNREPPHSPPRLDNGRLSDTAACVYDSDHLQSHLLHSRMTPVTTCIVDGLEGALAYPPTSTRDLAKMSGMQSVTSHHADLVEGKDDSSVSPEALLEDFRQVTKQEVENIVEALEAARAMAKTRRELAETLVDAIEEVTDLNSNNNRAAAVVSRAVHGKSGVVLSSSKVVLAAGNGIVPTFGTTTLAAGIEVEKQIGEFWANIGRVVPCTILFAIFFFLVAIILAMWLGPESQVPQV